MPFRSDVYSIASAPFLSIWLLTTGGWFTCIIDGYLQVSMIEAYIRIIAIRYEYWNLWYLHNKHNKRSNGMCWFRWGLQEPELLYGLRQNWGFLQEPSKGYISGLEFAIHVERRTPLLKSGRLPSHLCSENELTSVFFTNYELITGISTYNFAVSTP